jgi:hypothetical protein
MSASGASGDARKNAPPARVLPMAASARVIRRPVHHRLGRRVHPTLVAKQRLSGLGRLRRIFRADAAGCPHRATGRHGTAAHPLTRDSKGACRSGSRADALSTFESLRQIRPRLAASQTSMAVSGDVHFLVIPGVLQSFICQAIDRPEMQTAGCRCDPGRARRAGAGRPRLPASRKRASDGQCRRGAAAAAPDRDSDRPATPRPNTLHLFTAGRWPSAQFSD